MVYIKDFTSVTMNGTIASGNEIWSAGFHLDSVANPISPARWKEYFEARKDIIAGILEDFYSNAAVLAPYDAPMTSVKLAHIGTDGKYLEEAIEVEAFARGSNNTGYLPQGTLVTTLAADKFKDPGKYNRFYLPIAPANLAGNWCLTAGQQEAYATAAVEMINAMNAVLTPDSEGGFAQVNVVSSAGTGHSQGVSSVRVGAIVDTQRRRRNKLPEAYVTVPLEA